MYQLNRLPVVEDANPLGRTTPYTVEQDGVEVASGSLMARSWMGDETGRLVNVRWEDGYLDAARLIIEAALATAAPDEVNTATNADVHPDPAERVALFESLGFELWQEKEGFLWTDTGQELPEPDRVALRGVAEFGAERFAAVFAESAADTLDRIDADTVAAMGPAEWAAAFIGCFEKEIWQVAETPSGEPVGFVGVHEFDPGVGSITHISVLPRHRGHGYVDQLLRAANRRAREAGFTTMLSDSDTLNTPMHAALERNGHHAADTAWHKWMHRKKP